MFPTFISILDIQSWWEVPSIAHFCSLFRTAFNLLDFDIEDLEEALLTDGTEESSWLQELIVRLLSGCLPNNEISTFNYQMFLRRLFRQKCQEHDRYNPFNTDCDFTLLPLRTKVDILHALCDFRLDAEDVLDQLKNLEADSLRVEPLGYDSNDSAYWYFYGTRLYREDFQKKNNKKKSIWQVICFTEDDWFQLTKKFKNSSSKAESALYHTLSKNFLPELPRLFKEKERQARRRLLENQPRRTSDRIRKLDIETIERQEAEETKHIEEERQLQEDEQSRKRKEQENRRKESYERRSKLREESEGSQSEQEPEERHEMAAKKRGRGRQRKTSTESSDSKEITSTKRKKTRSSEREEPPKPAKPATVGRQTNNSLSAADGQIVIQPSAATTTTKKKLKTSQVFQQTDEDLQVGMHKILDFVKNHEDAWPFLDPVEEEYAPNYYSIIRRPMDLTRMEDRLDQGVYKTFDKFKSDFQLIVNNCRLYNGVENEYTEMVDNLLKVFEKATERYLDQISSSDEEIAVENLNSESDNEDTKILKHSKKKKHSESPPRTSNRGRKPVLAVQGKKRARSPSEESEKSVPKEEEILEEKPKKSKKQEKESKKALKLSKKEKKENKKSEKETKEIKKNEKESKKSDKEMKKVEKDSKENRKFEKELRESKKAEKEVKESKNNEKVAKENKKSEKETKENKKVETDIKESKKLEKEIKENKKIEKETKENKKSEKDWKENKKEEKETKKIDKESKKIEEEKRSKKQGKNSKSKKDKLECKKENKTKEKDSKPKKRGRKKKKVSPSRSRSRSFSTRSPSPSPVRSVLSTPPPSSPETNDFVPATKLPSQEPVHCEDISNSKKPYPWEPNPYFTEEPPPFSPQGKVSDQVEDDFSPYPPVPFAFKPAKDKHNKLRETIEKLKAKSEISRMQTPVYDFESDDHLKENKDKNKKVEKEEKGKHKPKDKLANKSKKTHDDMEDGNSSQSESIKKSSKKKEQHAKVQDLPPPVLPKPPKQSNFDALSLATEQTLKDINKWLDDTPKFADFSSASNSPSYLALDDFDLLGTPKPEPKKVEKIAAPISTSIPPPVTGVKKEGITAPVAKEGKKKPFRDPSKFFNKRREVQRTIDRLQPGKGKGNLISNVPNTTKPDEIFPLGPLSKMKDTKNSLIVKTDTNAPKLSLGSVLDSFGKHKFVDDPKKDDEEEKVATSSVSEEPKVEPKLEDGKEEKKVLDIGTKVEKDVKEVKPVEETSPGGPTPNLSAWFKAFGAPKAPPPQKKPENNKSETKEEESTAKSERVPVPDPSPSLDSPQPVARQRRISTGSSMSERSSFSQDLDSPRVGMDERGAYPAPYPSPLHRSPSGASPVMASPRPDISPRSAYPFNGQMRVGFYQDTVSNKSSPDKSCSPRDNPQGSPYYPPGDHVYAPNTTQSNIYSYANTPYYTHPPNYSSTNPTPPYNMDGSSSSYYDTTKVVGAEQYQAKPSQNYTANSPASSQPSPAPQPQLSPHSPIVHSQPSPSLHSQQSSVHSPSMHSPSVHSPSMHSPNINSPSMHSPSVNSPQLHSPNPALHSPSLSVHSPQMSVMSPQMSAMSPQMSVMSPQMSVVSPQMGVMSPQMSVVSPQMSVVSPQMSVVSPQMSVVSPQVNSPGLHSPIGVNSPHHSQVNSPINPPSAEQFHSQHEESSNTSGSMDTKVPQNSQNSNQNQPVFPVKKRAFVDSELSQFAALQDELVNRNLQMGHQLSLNPPAKPEAEIKQPVQNQQQHMLQQQLQQQMQKQQQQHLQQMQEQLLQQAQLQQQKSQQLLQQAHLQQQAQLQQQQKSLQQPQQQQLQKNQQQAQQHLQKNQQLLQQQVSMGVYSKSSDSSLRTPSPPIQQQSQQLSMSQQQALSQQSALSHTGQRNQQQVPAHSNNESASTTIRNMSYPAATTQSNPYSSSYTNREAFPLNIPSARSMQQHQQKLDMSKFTNMGYTGPEVNFSRALQQQYGRPELSYTRTTVQSAISQASQLLNSQSLTASQPSASSASSLPGYQKQATNQQQAHSSNYQSNRSVDSVAERLAAQAQQEAASNYKPDMTSSRNNYNSSTLDLDQALGLTRNISNLPNIVDRYSNEQRMMAGLQSSSNPYYTDKGLGTPHMFNKTMSSASQIFSQANMAAMSSYTQSMQQTSAATMYNRQMNELQAQAAQAVTAQTHPDLKSSAQAVAQDRKNRKKKSSSKSGTTSDTSQVNSSSSVQAAPTASSGSAQGFQSYAGLKGPPSATAAPNLASSALEPGAISLKTSSVVPGSAFNFGPAASGALGLSSGLYGDKDSYSNFLEVPNFYMAAAAAHHRSTPEGGTSGRSSQSGASSQTYPSFLNPAHQGRTPAYPLGGPFIPSSAQAQLMDTSSQLYQHYLQAGVLNQGLLGAPGAYPPGYHPALAMRQPYDSMSRPSWL